MAMGAARWTLGPQGAMRSDKVVGGLFQVKLPLEVMFRFREGERFAHQPSVALPGSQIVPTEYGRVTVDWWTHKIGGLHKIDFIMAAKTDELL